jgi:hypothetical protein
MFISQRQWLDYTSVRAAVEVVQPIGSRLSFIASQMNIKHLNKSK